MSRSWDEDDGDGLPYELWAHATMLALRGKRGRGWLRELEAALLALPEKKLLSRRIADEQGNVCAIGALYRHRKLAEGQTPEQIMSDLVMLDDDGVASEYEITEFMLGRLSIQKTLAYKIQCKNDEDTIWGNGCSDEERYERVLAWVRNRLEAPPLTRGATATKIGKMIDA